MLAMQAHQLTTCQAENKKGPCWPWTLNCNLQTLNAAHLCERCQPLLESWSGQNLG